MTTFQGNLEKLTLQNPYYRRVLYTTPHLQLVLMSLNPNQEVGMEIHPTTTQFVRIEKGTGIIIINRESIPVEDGDFVIVPPNFWHNIINTSSTSDLKLYTIYSPPEHEPGEIE